MSQYIQKTAPRFISSYKKSKIILEMQLNKLAVAVKKCTLNSDCVFLMSITYDQFGICIAMSDTTLQSNTQHIFFLAFQIHFLSFIHNYQISIFGHGKSSFIFVFDKFISAREFSKLNINRNLIDILHGGDL